MQKGDWPGIVKRDRENFSQPDHDWTFWNSLKKSIKKETLFLEFTCKLYSGFGGAQ